MTSDWKLILKVITGSVVLVLVIIFGLAKMSGSGNSITADQNQLLDGAKLVKENGETKVTVVVFSDMQCPACRLVDDMIGSLESMSGVRYVFRHYPLSIHKYSVISAKAVEAARVMGMGFEMKKKLFAKQDEWSGVTRIEEVLVRYAKELGLDEEIFLEKLNSTDVSTTIQTDMILGNSLKLSGTPTIFVNGEQVAGDFVVAKVNELLKTNGN